MSKRKPLMVQCRCGWIGMDSNLVAETPDSAHCPVCRAVFTAWPHRPSSDDGARPQPDYAAQRVGPDKLPARPF